jgi:serine/threonine protein kinase
VCPRVETLTFGLKGFSMLPSLPFEGDEYIPKETLRGEEGSLLRATRREDGRSVLIRVFPRASLRTAFSAAHELDIPAVARPLAWQAAAGVSALILDDDGSEPLERVLHFPLEMDTFLRIAVQLASMLADLHERGWVHKNVKPASILMHPVTRRMKFSDLELSSRLGDQSPVTLGRLEGSLPYISPEQTGRLNHGLDSRSDLYSLGIVLFQMRSGKLPFAAADPLGWVYRHLAQPPPKLKEVAPGTPAVVSDIVDKLLSKSPESRYQSAQGLKLDLQRCLDQWLRDKRIDRFDIATRDTSDRFVVPQRLYGRQKEVKVLLETFEDIIRQGAPALATVTGFSGVGKSTLVHELYKPLVRERGFFIEGKFEPNKLDIPYSTLSHAFGDLIRRRLSEDEEQLRLWGNRLRAALGSN